MLEKCDVVLFQGKAKSGKTNRAVLFAAKSLKAKQNVLVCSDSLNVSSKIYKTLCTEISEEESTSIMEKHYIFIYSQQGHLNTLEKLESNLSKIEYGSNFNADIILIDHTILVKNILNHKK
jgi:hypothetical protein